MAAPMAPDSPQCSCTMTLGLTPLSRKRDSMKSTCDFDRRQIVLRAALQHEGGAERGEVGNLRNVQPDVLGQHVGQAGQISSGFQPWRWKSTMSDCMNTAQP